MSVRKDFLSMPAPENYVAGLGRGATGFTTRSDLGPAREGPSEEQLKDALAKRAAALGQAPPTAYGATDKKGKDDDERDDDNDRFQNPDDEVGLFATGLYDKEDDEADRIFQDVDEKMDKRRKWRREEREKREREEYERQNPKISQQFADLKRGLSTISDEEWANLPEVGDLTGKNRRAKQNLRQRFYAVPDSVLAGARDAMQLDTSISAADGSEANGTGTESADGTMTNFADIGAAREKVLQVRLDQAVQGAGTDSIAGTSSTIDPKGYLTSLTSVERQNGQVAVEDVKRARMLLESVIKTNPKHGPGWIAAARLEFEAGKLQAAKNVIKRGCEFCPKNEDVWIEAVQMHSIAGETHNAKILVASAIRNNDKSVRLWIEASKLEVELESKKRVLRRALDAVPQSVTVWKEAVKLEEDPNDAKLLLARAVQFIPLSIELWLALARLETPEKAQEVLNAAHKAVPTSYEIWITACRLQEQMGKADMVRKVMANGVKRLAKHSAMLKREEWIAEAEKQEDEGGVLTCGAIIEQTFGFGLDEEDDRREIWLEDAKSSLARGKSETARAMLAYALRIFVTSKSLWIAAADLEKSYGNPKSVVSILEKAVVAVPSSEALWLQLARAKMAHGSVDDARLVLHEAFKHNYNNENVWLAAVQLEAEQGETGRARGVLGEARSNCGTDRVWIKSVAFERQAGEIQSALDLVNDAITRYPKADKLYMMKGQMYEAQSNLQVAREAYSAGTKACPTSVPLWLLLCRLEERAGHVVKARSVLDRAKRALPKNHRVLCEGVRLERRTGNMNAATQLMAQALQQCPKSGLLWSEKIWHLEPRTQRKTLSLTAVQKVENDPILFVSIARIFWGERKLDKAMTWFERGLLLDTDLGDTWAWYYKFLIQHGTDEKREEVVSKYLMAEPKHGEVFQEVAKDAKNAQKDREEILMMVVARLE